MLVAWVSEFNRRREQVSVQEMKAYVPLAMRWRQLANGTPVRPGVSPLAYLDVDFECLCWAETPCPALRQRPASSPPISFASAA